MPRAATAILRLRSARACGPARPLAGRRGTPLPPQHRLRSTERSSEMLMSTSTAAAPSISNCSSATSAVVVEPSTPNDLQRRPEGTTTCEAVLEVAARSAPLSPPHWRRAARSGLSLRESPSLKDGPGADFSYVVVYSHLASEGMQARTHAWTLQGRRTPHDRISLMSPLIG